MKTSSKVVMLVVTYLILTLDNILLASELVHDFKNPAFSGNGYSQHVLSINQLEVQREQNKEKHPEKQDEALKTHLRWMIWMIQQTSYKRHQK